MNPLVWFADLRTEMQLLVIGLVCLALLGVYVSMLLLPAVTDERDVEEVRAVKPAPLPEPEPEAVPKRRSPFAPKQREWQ